MEKELSSVNPKEMSNVSNQIKRIISGYYDITNSDDCSDKVHYLLGYLNNSVGSGVSTFSPVDVKNLICWINHREVTHAEYRVDGEYLPFMDSIDGD